MKCFYHNDLDGKASAAIVHKAYESSIEDQQYIEMDYDKAFPWACIVPNERVIIVDFSLPSHADMERLLSITEQVTWIDHHKSAIEKSELSARAYGHREIGRAGCELTWDYYFTTPVPTSIRYLGRYDVWDFDNEQEKENILDFQEGLKLENTQPASPIWKKLFTSNDWTTCRIIDAGAIARRTTQAYHDTLASAFAFKTTVCGYTALCCNAGFVTSKLFDSLPNQADLLLAFVYTGTQWKISFYSSKAHIDCSALAKKFGGGGHAGAAGCFVDSLEILGIHTGTK